MTWKSAEITYPDDMAQSDLRDESADDFES